MSSLSPEMFLASGDGDEDRMTGGDTGRGWSSCSIVSAPGCNKVPRESEAVSDRAHSTGSIRAGRGLQEGS